MKSKLPMSLKETRAAGQVDRRQLLRRSAAFGLGVPALLGASSGLSNAQGATVTFSCYGGSYNDNVTKAFLAPFQKKTGIKVELGANASLALAKLQVTTGGPAQWDIVELTGPEYEIGVKQNLFLPYDYKTVDASKIDAQYKKPYGIKYALFLMVMAWDQRKISDAQAPKTWADFWDTNRYPGKRAMSENIEDASILEAALLADGVSMDKLFPLDVDRSLKSLDRLGKKNIIWYSANQQPIQQLTSGEVALAQSFNGRVIPANRNGAQIGFTPHFGAISGDYLCVVKTATHAKEAFELISFMSSDDEADAEYMRLTTYTSSNSSALKLVDKELADTLPTSEKLAGKVFVKDDAWWAENLEKTTVRFKQWQIAS
jgi:putative spermidine/putrescine transport system substrate-binding protein